MLQAHEEAGQLDGVGGGSGVTGDPAAQVNGFRKIMKVLKCWDEGFGQVLLTMSN